jgi:hypothetical protein
MSELITCSIIGTAGRSRAKVYLNKRTWEAMCKKAESYIEANISDDWSKTHLISGGAAWSDHIAVNLYFKHPESTLTLHLPCKWDTENCQYIDNGKQHWAANPGKVSNKYHGEFSTKIKENTLEQIQNAVNQGANIIDTYSGFHDRNLPVGNSDHLLAFTFSSKSYPEDGGTKFTWDKSSCKNKSHFQIQKLIT